MEDTQKTPAAELDASFTGKHLAMLADVSPAAIFEYDLDAHEFLLLLNTERHLGLSAATLAQRIQSRAYASFAALLQDLLHKDDLAMAQDAHAQLGSKQAVRYMARIRQADGRYLWKNVYYCGETDAESGRHCLSGYISDIHDTKIYKGIFERFAHDSEHTFLCLDVTTDSYILFGAQYSQSPVLAVGSNYSRSIVDYVNTFVTPEDREVCLAQMQVSRVTEVLAGADHHSFTANFYDPVVGLVRKCVKFHYYDKAHGLVLLAVANQARQCADELEYARIIKEALGQARTDPLTGLYNRYSGEELVRKLLETSTGALHALMLVESDNFAQVGQETGPGFSDAVLADVALRLKRLFRGNDVVARLNGSQFMVFMVDIDEENSAVRKMEEIRRIFAETYVTEPHVPETSAEFGQKTLSCSVGLVFIKGRPKFGTALRNAQQSLQAAMQAGGDNVHIFQEKAPLTCPLPTRAAPGDAGSVLRLKERIFEMLYATADFEQSINMSLALIGGMLDVSRVYVFENAEGNQTTSNTFEWCNTGVSREIDGLQNMPFDPVSYSAFFDNNGLFHCPDIHKTQGPVREVLSRQGIQSLLQVAIKEEKEFKGFVGFDECRAPRDFTAEEMDVLCFVARIIGTFVRKKRMTDMGAEAERDKVEALDNLPSYIYVLDREYRLQYMNKMVKMLVPSARVGMRCHAALKGLDEPCPGCPAGRCEHGRCSVEIYNPRYNLWVISSAARINWAGKSDRILISCQDITSFKIMRAMS